MKSGGIIDRNNMTKKINQEQYDAAFAGKRDEALEHAMEIRKFEIDLYWKRAAYFWTFIGASFAGYGALEASSASESVKTELSVPLACLGLVFSFGWFCVNKGSKQWQENWENHVDLLEDQKIGPLYRVVLFRPKASTLKGRVVQVLTGPAPLSVSRINQLISLYVTLIWAILLIGALFPKLTTEHQGLIHVAEILFALVTCAGYLGLGKTSLGVHRPVALQRETEILPTSPSATEKPSGTVR